MDYGDNYDRSDYVQEEEKKVAPKVVEKEDAPLPMQPILSDGTNAAETFDKTTTLPSGFLSKLNKNEDKYKKAGIITPEEAVSAFTERGESMFASLEDQELINNMLGKTSPQKLASSPEALKDSEMPAEVRDFSRKLLEDDELDIKIAAATKPSAPPVASSKAKPPTSPAVPASAPSPPAKSSAQEGVRASSSTASDGGVARKIDSEQIRQLESKLNNLTDEEVEKVFQKVRASVTKKLADDMRAKYESSRANKPKINLPETTPIDPSLRSKYNDEFKDVEKILEKMYNDPIAVWRDLLKEPEKYSEGLDIEDPTESKE